MDLQAFAAMIREMRRTQKRYFRLRQAEDLKRARELESRVDRATDDILDGPPLFAPEPGGAHER